MCQAGIGDPLTRWLLQNPFNGVGGVNPELLSIRQLVSVVDEEGSGCDDAKARGPPSGHRVQSLRKVCQRPLPQFPLLRQDPLSYSLLLICKQLEWLIWVRQGKGWGF